MVEIYQLLILSFVCSKINASLYSSCVCTQPRLKELELIPRDPLWPKRRGEGRERERGRGRDREGGREGGREGEGEREREGGMEGWRERECDVEQILIFY